MVKRSMLAAGLLAVWALGLIGLVGGGSPDGSGITERSRVETSSGHAFSVSENGSQILLTKTDTKTGAVLISSVVVVQSQGTARFPALRVDSEGNLHLFWLDERNKEKGNYELYQVQLNEDAQKITSERQISQAGVQGKVTGYDVVQGQGTLHAAWVQKTASDTGVMYSALKNSGEITGPRDVKGKASGEITGPWTRMFGNGVAILYGIQKNGSPALGWSEIDSNGNLLVREIEIHPSMAMLSSGFSQSSSNTPGQGGPTVTPSNLPSNSSRGSGQTAGASSQPVQSPEAAENFPGHPIFDARYVNATGDTMTGTLVLSDNANFIMQNGLMVLGTITAQEKLNVAGNIRLTGDILSTGNGQQLGSLQKPFDKIFVKEIVWGTQASDTFEGESPGFRIFDINETPGAFTYRFGTNMPANEFFRYGREGMTDNVFLGIRSGATFSLRTNVATQPVGNEGTQLVRISGPAGRVDLFDSTGTNSVGFRAPATIPASTVWTVPAADGSTGQVLTTSGAGVLSWETRVSGTGTASFVAKFTGTTTVGNSQIFDNGTNVGINTAAPTERLDVNGNVAISGTIVTPSVTSASIVNGTITTADLATAAVTNTNLAPDAVTTDKILNGTVQAVDLAAGAARDNLGITQNQVDAIAANPAASATNPYVAGTGTANRVTFWTGPNNVFADDDFVWDNFNKFLGIGTTSSFHPLEVASQNAQGYNAKFGKPGIRTSGVDKVLIGSSIMGGTPGNTGNSIQLDVTHDVATGSPSAALSFEFRNNTNTSQFGGLLIKATKVSGQDKATVQDLIGFPMMLSYERSQTLHRWFTDGQERMRIDNNGNVGIGTESPVSKLDIRESSGVVGLRVGNSDDDGRGLGVKVTGSGGIGTSMVTTTSSGYALALGINGTEGMRITTAGNVGIGTTSPGTSSLLELSSTTKGFVLPRMTQAQRNAISNPVEGMMIYQKDNTPGLRVYNGMNWMRFTETAD